MSFIRLNNQLILLLLLFCVEATIQAQKPQPTKGQIIRLDTFPSALVKARTIDIWLPSDYDAEKNQRYAVLYMHDGQMLFDSSTTWNQQEWKMDETMDVLNHSKDLTKAIVVGIHNGGPNRHREYCPQKPFLALPTLTQDSLLHLGRRVGGSPLFNGEIISDQYLRFIVQELKPYIDQRFRTLSAREHTLIGGSSMGGLISLYGICEYPTVFGTAICLSTHWPLAFTVENNAFPEKMEAYLEANLPRTSESRIYFDYGTMTLDGLYKPYQQRIDALMKRKGFDATHWVTIEQIGDDHSEKSWAKRLPNALRFALRK
ncbi:MAG: alpha/beta hydrolase [Ferruginibacter sp.]